MGVGQYLGQFENFLAFRKGIREKFGMLLPSDAAIFPESSWPLPPVEGPTKSRAASKLFNRF
jgi:hypothetical protein